jgi:hypothetical protein
MFALMLLVSMTDNLALAKDKEKRKKDKEARNSEKAEATPVSLAACIDQETGDKSLAKLHTRSQEGKAADYTRYAFKNRSDAILSLASLQGQADAKITFTHLTDLISTAKKVNKRKSRGMEEGDAGISGVDVLNHIIEKKDSLDGLCIRKAEGKRAKLKNLKKYLNGVETLTSNGASAEEISGISCLNAMQESKGGIEGEENKGKKLFNFANKKIRRIDQITALIKGAKQVDGFIKGLRGEDGLANQALDSKEAMSFINFAKSINVKLEGFIKSAKKRENYREMINATLESGAKSNNYIVGIEVLAEKVSGLGQAELCADENEELLSKRKLYKNLVKEYKDIIKGAKEAQKQEEQQTNNGGLQV